MDRLNENFSNMLFSIEKYIPNLNSTDREIVFSWITYLNTCSKTTKEAQFRNAFFHKLLNCCEIRELTQPFDKKPPPNESILNLIKSHKGYISTPEDVIDVDPGNPLIEVIQRSPDQGAFLMSQPVPRCGAFCYLTVVSRKPK